MIKFVSSARERAKHKRSLARHVSPATMKLVSRRPDLLKLSAEMRTMTFLVCRIRGFTEIAASFATDPDGLARLTRRAMTPMAKAVLDRQGTVDRLTPGCLTAFFNAPLDDSKHAFHACSAALAMMDALGKVNTALERGLHADGTPIGGIGLGIGINTGAAVVGNFGTEERPAYTVTGRAAEMADELERLSADYGTAMLVGGTTRELAEKNFAFLEVDHVDLTESPAVPLFALLGTPLSRANPKFMALKTFHDRIFQAYRGREWEKARVLISQARALSGANPVLYDLYLRRIAQFETHSQA